MNRLIEIDRSKIINMGGSQYVKLPAFLKRETGSVPGDDFVWFRETNDSDPIIKIEKQPGKVS